MTTLLYHTDAYMRTCTATVTGHSTEGNGVILDQTIAYCTSGGQPHDTGTMRADGQEYSISEVKKTADGVVHLLMGESRPTVGATVNVTIDWERRYRLMRTHTAMQ